MSQKNQTLDELIEGSTMVVASKYRLLVPISIKEGTWNKTGAKEKVHENKVLPRSFVEQRNRFDNNELYIIDKQATAKYIEDRAENVVKNAEKEKRSQMSTADLVEAIVKQNNPTNSNT